MFNNDDLYGPVSFGGGGGGGGGGVGGGGNFSPSRGAGSYGSGMVGRVSSQDRGFSVGAWGRPMGSTIRATYNELNNPNAVVPMNSGRGDAYTNDPAYGGGRVNELGR